MGFQVPTSKQVQQGVCHTLWPCHLHFKMCFKAKEELWKLKYFTMQKHNLQKILQNPSRAYNSITNLKFQLQPKYHLSKILI
jgi:hypothetical protein